MDDRERLLRRLADGEWHAGDALGAILGAGPERIAAALDAVRELGIDMRADEAGRVSLEAPLELLDAGRIAAAMSAPARACLGGVEVRIDVDSTNARLAAGARDVPRACLAERQTRGRGRRGRGWVSPFGANVYLSLLWPFARPAASLSGLSLAAGVAVAEAIEAVGAERVAIKWPNDLLLGGRKLAGILVEVAGASGAPPSVVVGTGINVRMPARDAARVDQPWADLAGLPGGPPGRNTLAAAVLDRLVEACDTFERDGLAAFLERFAARDAARDRPVTVRVGRSERGDASGDDLAGIARGIDADGALIVDADGTRHRVLSGDVSMRIGASTNDEGETTRRVANYALPKDG